MFLIIWRVCVVVAPAGSDSPDQAVEAEEVVKQLEIEQVEEIPAGTATAVQDLPSAVPLYPTRPPPLPAQQSPIASAAPPLPPSAPPPPPPRRRRRRRHRESWSRTLTCRHSQVTAMGTEDNHDAGMQIIGMATQERSIPSLHYCTHCSTWMFKRQTIRGWAPRGAPYTCPGFWRTSLFFS